MLNRRFLTGTRMHNFLPKKVLPSNTRFSLKKDKSLSFKRLKRNGLNKRMFFFDEAMLRWE